MAVTASVQPDGRNVAFARERNGVGTLVLRGRGPVARLGHSPGHRGHHDWRVAWRA